MSGPVLAATTIKPAWSRVSLDLRVFGGLNYLKGNTSPHFSLTCWYSRKGFPDQCEGGGADHALILKHFPRFADLAALHLSDMDGTPMHAVANGLYHLGYGKYASRDFGHVAKHFRITRDEAEGLAESLSGIGNGPEGVEVLAAWVDTQRPRWKAEAEACIAKHGLSVFGDTWEPAT